MSSHRRRRDVLTHERHNAHVVFDRIWRAARNRRAVRRIAYAWLAHQLNVPARFCHFGRLKVGTLKRAIRICRNADLKVVMTWWRHQHGTRRLRKRVFGEERIPKSSKTYYETRPR